MMKFSSPICLFAAMLLSFVGLANAVETPQSGQQQVNKIIFLGNSITNHGPAPQIGWTGSWGMAASAKEKDYAHLVVQGLGGEGSTPPEAKFINIADFERNYETYDVSAQLKEAIDFAPEMIVLAIGENVAELKTEQAQASFKSNLLKLLAAFKKENSPRIIIRSSFWANKAKDDILKEVAQEVNGTYVDISSLCKDEANYVRSERDFQHQGVAAHPGDKGMKAIADAILAKILGTTYYVSSDGDDTADGLSPATAWKTLFRANKVASKPGDSILFRRGDEFRGQLSPHCGKDGIMVTYGAYGEGKKPVLLGSVSRNRTEDWTHEGGNIWSTTSICPQRDGIVAEPYKEDHTRDVGNIIFDNGAKPCGFKRWNEADLKQPGDYWYDLETNQVKLVCEKNPAEAYDDIELAIRRHIIGRNHANHIIIEDLALLYGGAHGIGGYGYHNTIIRRLDVGFIGGGNQHGRLSPEHNYWVRFGNGIEFWGTAHDCLVEDCRIWECYDAALTPQGNNDKNFENITYRNNTIWNCEFSFEYWNRPETAQTINVSFINNRCYNAGGGWGHRQRPDKGGRQLCFYGRPAPTKNFRIEGNLFYGATNNAFFAHMTTQEEAVSHYLMDKNQWYQAEGDMMFFRDKKYTMAQFEEYKKAFNAKNSTLAPADLEVPPYPTNLRPVK